MNLRHPINFTLQSFIIDSRSFGYPRVLEYEHTSSRRFLSAFLSFLFFVIFQFSSL